MLKRSFLTSMGHQGVFAVLGAYISVVAINHVHLAIQDREYRRRTVAGLFSVIPANNQDPSVTTVYESAAIESGATDTSRPEGFIRACRLLPDGLLIPLQQGNTMPRTSRRTRPCTDEPSAHPWHQISNSSCTKRQALSGKRRNDRAN